MTQEHYLDDLFHPEGVAIIGASEREGSVGNKVMANMMSSQFAGGLFPVNLKHTSVLGKACVPSVKDIQGNVDLAVITTPASTVPGILEDCGAKGIRSAIIISAGFSEMGAAGKELEQSALAIARNYNIHFIGPNCLGVMRPEANLNATFENNFALPGSIALVSQSGAICAAILDWAMNKEIGFSTIVSMGNSIDLDFGEILDYLAQDPSTKSILLYIEGVHYPASFLKGLAAASRVKPVIAIKGGRNGGGGRAVHSHTGALVGNDDVFTAALARGGAVRVTTIEQLFTAAELLSSAYRVQGNRLTVITNGGGAGVMASDCATDLQINLPPLSAATISNLNKMLPPQWSHQNPIDIIGDATPERYRNVVETCFQDDSDALLTILVPISMTQPYQVAEELCASAKKNTKPLLVCWMGEKQVETSWQLFSEHKIPCYRTPEVAVEAFSFLAQYDQHQQLLRKVPAPYTGSTKPDTKGTESIMNKALAEQRNILTTLESKAILKAFSIPVSQTREAHSIDEAVNFADSVGYPVVMKISSPDITHKQEVGGVKLNLQSPAEVRSAYQTMLASVRRCSPQAKISGVTLERMYNNTNYRELMIGIVHDKVFGPALVFGMGGSLVEVIRDRAIELPPLNAFLATQMIAKTRAMKLLGEFRGKPPVNMDALITVLLRVSDMILALPQIKEMDINPLLIDENEAVVVDARFVIDTRVPIAQTDAIH